jgi:serine/threonine-protein kinase RsbW
VTTPVHEHVLTITEWPGGLEGLVAALHRLGAEWRMSEDVTETLCLVLEELVGNVFDHGFEQPGGEVTVHLTRRAGAFEAELIDAGPPFDPLQALPPDLEAGIEERAIGGLGVHLARSLMDEISYRREHDTNRLVLTKHLDDGDAAAGRDG